MAVFLEALNICSGVKLGCVLAPALFSTFIAVMLNINFGTSTDSVYLHTRSSGNLFRLSKLKSKSKMHQVPSEKCCFAVDAALTVHSEEHMQHLMDKLSKAC